MSQYSVSQTFVYDKMSIYTREGKGYKMPPKDTNIVWEAIFNKDNHTIIVRDTINKAYSEFNIIANEVKDNHYTYETTSSYKDTCIIDVFSDKDFYILDLITPSKLIRYSKKK